MPKQEIITGVDHKQYVLPEGVRSIDIINMTNEDANVILDLFTYGRRSRSYYYRRGDLHIVRRLKSRGFIVAVRNGTNYSYDLSRMGYFAVEKHFV